MIDKEFERQIAEIENRARSRTRIYLLAAAIVWILLVMAGLISAFFVAEETRPYLIAGCIFGGLLGVLVGVATSALTSD